MDVFEAIKVRRSIRRYRPEPIPEEKLVKILEAARLAPSAGNRQPWRFVVVKDPEKKKELAKASRNQMFIADAGVVIVALADPRASARWYKLDTMIAVEHMVLEAVELGLGTCWIGAFDEEAVKKIIDAPHELSVVCLLPIGVPDESPSARPRKKPNEIFFDEVYGKPYKYNI